MSWSRSVARALGGFQEGLETGMDYRLKRQRYELEREQSKREAEKWKAMKGYYGARTDYYNRLRQQPIGKAPYGYVYGAGGQLHKDPNVWRQKEIDPYVKAHIMTGIPPEGYTDEDWAKISNFIRGQEGWTIPESQTTPQTPGLLERIKNVFSPQTASPAIPTPPIQTKPQVGGLPLGGTALAGEGGSPYKEYPDAFQEDGVWKVIRNGKKYRIEE